MASSSSSSSAYTILFFLLCVFLSLSSSISSSATETKVEKEYVLTLDHSNFTEIVSKHKFIVVEFYAPWCGHCKSLAPKYEKAASVLSSNEPPVTLAKVDANAEENKELAAKYGVKSFPTIKILKNRGEVVYAYQGSREADDLIEYFKKQVGPPSFEIKTQEDAKPILDDNKVFVAGIFPKFFGEEFENFMRVADKLRNEYDFVHTTLTNAELLPRGESVTTPTVRLLKPFDELVIDFQKFEVDALENFIKEASFHEEQVLTLDHSNFTETVSKHKFIVVEFYAPWCGHCKTLAPKYEKAASVLASHEPAVVLAKIDASAEENKELAAKYEIKSYPKIKILKNEGEVVQDYEGSREANAIIEYLKKQVGPPSFEIKTTEDAKTVIDVKKVFVVGIFPKFSGEEFENYMVVADKLRNEYEFVHTTSAELLPLGESVTTPTVRLLKPFDELVVDFQKFEVDALENFIKKASIPLVTIFEENPDNDDSIIRYFQTQNAKVMLFLDFGHEDIDAFKSEYTHAAGLYKEKGLNFLLADLKASEGALKHFGLKDDESPALIIQTINAKNFISSNVKPDQIAPWLKNYVDGKVKPSIRSQPIPETNDEPVKVVVAKNLKDMVLDSKKNILLEIYAPWCGHCKKLAPILDEVAVSFENDASVMITKIDGSSNDIPGNAFEAKGYPTMYFKSSSGKVMPYEGNRTKEDIIDFIQKYREDETPKQTSLELEWAKDEL